MSDPNDPSGPPEAAGFDRDVRLEIYRRFLEAGSPPSISDVAAAMGAPAPEVQAAFRRLDAGHAIVLHPGTTDIWMANPLSGTPTAFAVEAGGRSLWGNCIWDALGVVAMLGAAGRVRTSCADCGQPMTMSVSGGALEPVEAVAHFAVPAAHWWDEIGHT